LAKPDVHTNGQGQKGGNERERGGPEIEEEPFRVTLCCGGSMQGVPKKKGDRDSQKGKFTTSLRASTQSVKCSNLHKKGKLPRRKEGERRLSPREHEEVEISENNQGQRDVGEAPPARTRDPNRNPADARDLRG